MNTHKHQTMLSLLDPPTVRALNNIYDITLKHMGVRLNCTPQAVWYLLQNNAFKDFHREILLQLYLDHGLEYTELLLIHTMTHKGGQRHEVN